MTENGQQDDKDILEPDNALPEITFLQLPPTSQAACTRAGWAELMPVQARTIPYIMARRDLMVQARTGSGKTGAFVLPILERIDASLASCQALILVPTRELARQVANEVDMLGKDSGIRSVAVYGGVGYGPQLDAFEKGVHLVVGTPGRILDHLIRRNLTLEALSILVFDEADRMLSMGFYPDMKQVQTFLPRLRINGYMFSATFPPHVLRLAGQFLNKPEFLSLSRDHVHVTDTEHSFYIVPAMEKDRCLVRIIEMENPSSALIFCNTKAMVHYVAVVLKRFGYDADELSADLTQRARESVLDRVKKGKLRFLVATDVAARGIDIQELSHVFQYEPPEDPEAYVHRAGRTGRAGAAGAAISLVAGMEQTDILRIAKRFGISMIERPIPTDADVQAIVSQRIIALLEARLRDRDGLKRERMQRFVPLAQLLGQGEDSSQLLAMLLDDYYQDILHAEQPQPVVPVTKTSSTRGRPPRSSSKRRPPRKDSRHRSKR
ncbi:MAG: DEAD/DEAH box helicase [candidate division Zixibacteria bacterium]|nr:DEAD/DEAH box helicase [candidate division Zixibacteria bacterium]